MKHAIMIMAHKDVGFLCRLISRFPKECDVFVHYDKKAGLGQDERKRICDFTQVKHISEEYEVNWGGTSVLYAEMSLLHDAFHNSEATYFHLISGQDYPICPFDKFDAFFEENEGKNFVKYVHLPNPRWEQDTFRRFQYYFPFDLAADKENPRGWVMEQVREQQKRGIKRRIPDEFDHLYGGSQWFSINREAAKALLEYTKEQPSLYNRMWMTFAPEESYVATVLVNLLGKEKVISDNHRYIRWKDENGNCPANLSTVHFRHLLDGQNFFARKFEKGCSEELLNLIDKYLLGDAAIVQGLNGRWIYDGYRKYAFEEAFCSFVERLCRDVGIKSAIDIGCGAGQYVDRWRRRNLPFAGYDANPCTPSLSRLLLDGGEEVCGIADITGELSIDDPFELVVCKDVLPYIPCPMEDKAIENISRLSSHFIVLSWKLPNVEGIPEGRSLVENGIEQGFRQYGFVVENYLTARMHVALDRKDCCVLTKRGKQLLESRLCIS